MAGVGQCHQGPKGQVSTSQPLKGKEMLRFTPNRTTDLADIRDPDAIRVTIDTQELAERRLFRELNERLRGMAGVAEQG